MRGILGHFSPCGRRVTDELAVAGSQPPWSPSSSSCSSGGGELRAAVGEAELAIRAVQVNRDGLQHDGGLLRLGEGHLAALEQAEVGGRESDRLGTSLVRQAHLVDALVGERRSRPAYLAAEGRVQRDLRDALADLDAGAVGEFHVDLARAGGWGARRPRGEDAAAEALDEVDGVEGAADELSDVRPGCCGLTANMITTAPSRPASVRLRAISSDPLSVTRICRRGGSPSSSSTCCARSTTSQRPSSAGRTRARPSGARRVPARRG